MTADLKTPDRLLSFRAFLRGGRRLPPMPSAVMGERLGSHRAGRAERLCLAAAIVAALAVAAALRFYHLGTWPPPHVDEVIGGVAALNLDFSSRLIEPSLAHYLPIALLPQAAVFEIFGVSVFTLRLVSVLYGLGAVACIYWAGRSLFSPATGLLAASILATSHIVIAISRFGGAGNSQAIFFATLCLATYGQACKSGGWWWIIWGAVTGLGLYSYEGFRAVPVGIALAVLFQPRLLWRVRGGILAALAACVVVASPLLVASASDPDKYLEESRQLSVFGNPTSFKDFYRVSTVQDVLLKQFELSYKYFFDGGNRDSQYMFRGAGLDAGTQGLVIAGLIVGLIRIRRLAYRTLLFCLALGLLGSTITESPPLVPRLVMLMPPAALLMAAPVGEIVNRLFRSNLVGAGIASTALAVALTITHAGYYFDDYTLRDVYWQWIEPNRSIGQYIGGLPASDRVYLLRTPGVWREHGQLRFALLEHGRDSLSVTEITDWNETGFNWSKTKLTAGVGSAYIIGPPEAQEVLKTLVLHCPDAVLRNYYGYMRHSRPDTDLRFSAVRISNLDCLPKPTGG